jgi:preprotein translocase subunit SecG
MDIVLMVLMFLVALFLIMLVLIQRGRGGGLAGALGGMGGQSAFGTKAGDLFTRVTIVAATVWIVLCMATIKLLATPQNKFADYQGKSAGPAVPGGPTAPATGGEANTTPGAPANGGSAPSGENKPATPPAAKDDKPATTDDPGKASDTKQPVSEKSDKSE